MDTYARSIAGSSRPRIIFEIAMSVVSDGARLDGAKGYGSWRWRALRRWTERAAAYSSLQLNE